MGRAINAMTVYDTGTLYKIIDTSYCFDIYGKDGFLSKLTYINKRFTVCVCSIGDSPIRITAKPAYSQVYAIPFLQKC